jgi:hypothetical protein
MAYDFDLTLSQLPPSIDIAIEPCVSLSRVSCTVEDIDRIEQRLANLGRNTLVLRTGSSRSSKNWYITNSHWGVRYLKIRIQQRIYVEKNA